MKSVMIFGVAETAKLLHIARWRVVKLINQGKLKGIKYKENTSKYRIFSTDIEKYLLKNYKDATRKDWDKRCQGVKK